MSAPAVLAGGGHSAGSPSSLALPPCPLAVASAPPVPPGERSSSGLLEWDSKSDALETLGFLNHYQMKNPSKLLLVGRLGGALATSSPNQGLAMYCMVKPWQVNVDNADFCRSLSRDSCCCPTPGSALSWMC